MDMILSNATTMSTNEIAKLTGKQHKNVLATTRKFFKDNGLSSAEFSAQFKSLDGRMLDCFDLNKRYSLALVALIDNSFLMAVIDRWQELENGKEIISTDPIIAMRQKQIQLEGRLDAIEATVETKLIESSSTRELRKDKPPIGYENKGDTATNVSKITQTTKAIVYAVLDAYSEDITKKTYIVECTDEADNVIETTPVCYLTFDVINAVKHAVKNSEKKTECFRVFKTLSNIAMKLKRD